MLKIKKTKLEELINDKEVAKTLNVSVKTVQNWRSGPVARGPKFVKFGNGLVRYFPSDVLEFINSSKQL